MRAQVVKKSKTQWANQCVICLSKQVDGAHIYPAGSFPKLADVKYNIIPLCREHHQEFDELNWHRKINWLQELTCKPAEMRQWLLALHMIKVNEYKGDKE